MPIRNITLSSSSHSNILLNLGGLMSKHPSKRAHRLPLRLSPDRQEHIPYLAPDDHDFNPTRTVIYDAHPSPPKSSPTISSPPPPPPTPTPTLTTPSVVPAQIASAPDSESRSKIVAGILLHRVHAVGKPIRRKILLDHDVPRTYVRSGLSTTINLESS